jgi:hypothetical protein
MKNPVTSFFKNLSPSAYVFLVTTAIVLLAGAARYKAGQAFDPNVTFEDGSEQSESATKNAAYKVKASTLGQQDISVRYADRVRDASALSLGLGLHILHERISNNRVIPNVRDVLREFARSDLMPPRMTVLEPTRPTEYGLVATPLGLYFVRYRPTPLTIEVLAVGTRGLEDGAVFMIRLPEAQPAPATDIEPQNYAGGYATIFVAPFANAPVPVAFSSSQAYAAAGWRQEPLRTTPFPPEKVAALRNWLASYNAQN